MISCATAHEEHMRGHEMSFPKQGRLRLMSNKMNLKRNVFILGTLCLYYVNIIIVSVLRSEPKQTSGGLADKSVNWTRDKKGVVASFHMTIALAGSTCMPE